MNAFYWEKDQQNKITFVMIDAAGTEVSGLGAALTINISKNGGAFAAAAGSISEIGSGWYEYTATAAEADTVGPVAITASGVGTIQQNLEYVVRARTINAVEFDYVITNSVTLLPIEGVAVAVSTDIAGSNVIFNGRTDAFGMLRHLDTNEKPLLDPGSYYFWPKKSGFSFTVPDLEIVS